MLERSFRIIFQDIQSGELGVDAGRLRCHLQEFAKHCSRLWVAVKANQNEAMEIPADVQRIYRGHFAPNWLRFLEPAFRDQA